MRFVVCSVVIAVSLLAGNRSASGQAELIAQGISKFGPPVCIFLAQHLGGKLLDGAFDHVTGKPNVWVLQQRLEELEKNGALKVELQEAIRNFRLELDERVTRDELDRRLAGLTDKLVGLHLRIENLEIDRELHQVRLDDIQNKTQNALSPKYFVDRGNQFQSNGDYVRAHANYTAALKVDENYAPAYVARAVAHLEVSAIEVAEIDFVTALEKDEQSKDARIGKAAISLELGRYSDGLAEASAVLASNPDWFDPHFIRGWCYLNSSHMEEALLDFRQCVALEPGSPVAHNALAVALWKNSDYAEAEKEFGTSLELMPRQGTYLNRALMRNEQTYYASAVEDFNASLSYVSLKPNAHTGVGLSRTTNFVVNPKPIENTALPYEERGIAFHHLGEFEKSIEDLSRAIEIGTTNGWSYVVRGASYSKLGNHASAISDFNEGLRLGVGEQESFVYDSLVYSNLSIANYHDAALNSDRYFASKNADTSSARVHYNAFVAKESSGKSNDAYTALQAAIAIDPTIEAGLTCGYVKVINKTSETVDLCPDYWINFDDSKTDVNNNWIVNGTELFWRLDPGEESIIVYDGAKFRAKTFSAWLERSTSSAYSSTWTWTLPDGAAEVQLEIAPDLLP